MTVTPTAAPVDVRVRLDGAPLGSDLQRHLVELRVRHVVSRPTAVELLLSGEDEAFGRRFSLGQEIVIDLGGGTVVGDITSIAHHHDSNGGRLLRVRAFDRLHRLGRMQAVRAFPDGDLADLVRRILAEADLRLDAVGRWPQVQLVHQYCENDLATLTGVLDRFGARLVVTGDRAALLSTEADDGSVTLRLGADLTDLTRSATSEGIATEVHALAWDLERADVIDVQAVGSAGPTPADGGGPAAPRWLRDVGAVDETSARAQAQAVLDRAGTASSTYRGRAVARPDLHPGAVCDFQDHSGATLGRHVLEVVDHRVTGSGLVSEFSTRAPRSRSARVGSATSGSAITRGLVVDVDDPSGRCRVRVSLPTYGAVTPWIDVLLPAAGPDRGLIAMPDVDDVVVVAVPDGDLLRAVVLGCLLGPSGPARAVVEGQTVMRHAWHSSADQYVQLDDSTGTVTVRNDVGSRVVLGPELLELHSETDLVIEAPGRTITIRAAAVEFEQVEP